MSQWGGGTSPHWLRAKRLYWQLYVRYALGLQCLPPARQLLQHSFCQRNDLIHLPLRSLLLSCVSSGSSQEKGRTSRTLDLLCLRVSEWLSRNSTQGSVSYLLCSPGPEPVRVLARCQGSAASLPLNHRSPPPGGHQGNLGDLKLAVLWE